MTTDAMALLAEALQTVDDMRNEHKTHGHITDASAHWLIKIKPRITALLDSGGWISEDKKDAV